MEAAFEHIEALPQQSWKYHIRSEPTFEFNWHFHAECELTLIMSGSGWRLVGDALDPFSPGDLVLLGPDLPHAYTAEPLDDLQPQAVVAQFRPGFLGAALLDTAEFAGVRALLRRSGRGLSFGAAADPVRRRLVSMRDVRPPMRTVELLSLLVELAGLQEARPLASIGYRPAVDGAGRATVNNVCRFLASAYSRSITLAEVAEVAHLTPSGLSRSFRRATGRSVVSYLIEVRIAAACRMLVATEGSIADIASACGYANLSNFNRQFRAAKHMSPRQYRQAYSGSASPDRAVPPGRGVADES